MDSFVKWLLLLCIFIFALYKYGTRNFKYWKNKGVKQLKPIPFIGDSFFGFLSGKNVLEQSEDFYKPFKDIGFGGIYMGTTPLLSVADPELLKKILVKDSDYFINRHDWIQGSDPLMKKNLVYLKDESWKKMRAVMTTAFTSAKMKDMFGFVDKCAEQSVNYLEEKMAKESGKGDYEIDCKDFFSRYGTDVIASSVFGLEVDSFRNPENEFYCAGNFVLKMLGGGWRMFKMLFIVTFPKITKLFGMTFFGDDTNDFFISLVDETIREREKKNIVRKDVIHVLMDARKGKGVNEEGDLINGKLPDLTNADIAAQAIQFFFGGFEVIASLLGFITYELALQPDVQENLQREIDEVIERENGITYDGVVHQMQYLYMVISETLRKWPLANMTDRQLTKSYTIPATAVTPEVALKKGDSILVPIAAIHYDPEYYPNPEKFDPERFRDEKNTIKPFTYLPFGEGPRHCIGMRFALMETKIILVHLLRKFTLVPSKKTCIPLELNNKQTIALQPKGGFWLALKRRT